MAYVITEACISDGACVTVCPLDCIVTAPGEKQYYIRPDVCTDCGACVAACPVEGAVFAETDVPAEHLHSIAANAAFFARNEPRTFFATVKEYFKRIGSRNGRT